MVEQARGPFHLFFTGSGIARNVFVLRQIASGSEVTARNVETFLHFKSRRVQYVSFTYKLNPVLHALVHHKSPVQQQEAHFRLHQSRR